MPAPKNLGDTPDAVETAFYEAIAHADLDALMALWVDDEEIVCIHPSAPRLVGHAAIRASWEVLFERGPIPVRAVQLHAIQNMSCSVHSIIERVQLANDAPQDVHILATNVYLKTPHGWRLSMHHASVAAGAPPPDLFKASVLH